MKKIAARVEDAVIENVGAESVSASISDISIKVATMAQTPPIKQRSSRKRTKSMGNLRIRSQADKDLVPPRPPNAWILYRSAKFKEFKAKQESAPSSGGVTPPLSACPTSVTSQVPSHPGLQAEVSRIISDMWKTERQDVKMEYVKLAEEKKNQHMEMFPDYKYRPKRQQVISAVAAASKSEDEEKLASAAAEKKKAKAKALAKPTPGSITVDMPFLLEKIDVDSAAILDSPILLEYAATAPSLVTVASPMQEDTEGIPETQAQLIEEMRQMDWLRTMASSHDGEEDEAAAAEVSPSTASSFDQVSQEGLFSTPLRAPRFALPDETGSPLMTPLSALSHQRWNTPLSSSTSWHSTVDAVPWNCTEMIETLDDEDSGSNHCPPLSPTPDYSTSSSPFHPYSSALATSGTMSPSSLYLGLADTQNEDQLQPSYNFSATPSDIADYTIIRASSLNPHAASYPESYFPRFQETVPLYHDSTDTSVDLHSHSPTDEGDGNGNQPVWSAPLMQKSHPNLSQPLPTRQHPPHHQVDGLGIVSLALDSSKWQTHPLPTLAHLHHIKEIGKGLSLHLNRSSRADYTSGHHHHHHHRKQQQVSFPLQCNPRSVPWQEDYHAHQDLIHQLDLLAREDASSTAIPATTTSTATTTTTAAAL